LSGKNSSLITQLKNEGMNLKGGNVSKNDRLNIYDIKSKLNNDERDYYSQLAKNNVESYKSNPISS